MASIRERIDENGQKSYQAQVRIQGYPPRSKTFLRKTDAKKWAVQTETEIRTGMHIRQSQAGKHTAKEMLEKYKDEKLTDKAGKGKDQRTQLNWWIEQIGEYVGIPVDRDRSFRFVVTAPRTPWWRVATLKLVAATGHRNRPSGVQVLRIFSA